ncbi:uncharacterized protein LOC141612124 [Silene latifolia]|uniref:uncharacterized protein LOC141612124 n=1 Tax=Silene latifolia TaxID=37657 RepID=UPI003D776BAE
MEFGGRILDVIDEEASFDADMIDVEEGEVVDRPFSSKIIEGDVKELEAQLRNLNTHNANDVNKKKKNKKKKRKNKKARAVPGPTRFDLDRFVIGVCKRLREKKSYLVYTAVGILGASALSDLVKEVEAIQACGGQKTAEGNRYRFGGGILWNILKTRDPNAYREIMKKGKEFEKQFRRPHTVSPTQNNIVSQDAGPATVKPLATNLSDDPEMKTSGEAQLVMHMREIRKSVHDRIRIPVSYDDLPGAESLKDQVS